MDDKKQQPLAEKETDYDVGGDRRLSAAGRKNDVTPEVIAGEMFDERYERTQRGLKSRYVFCSCRNPCLHGQKLIFSMSCSGARTTYRQYELLVAMLLFWTIMLRIQTRLRNRSLMFDS